MAKSSINKIRNLKQQDEAWEVAVHAARTWIEPPKGDPYRPWYVFIMSVEDKIIRYDRYPKKPTAHEVLESLFKAMRRPMLGAGKKRRPSIVLFDNEAFYKEISPMLSEISIESKKQNSLPYSYAALKTLDERMRHEDDLKSLLSIPGVTVPLLARIFEATAAYYRLAPWEMLQEEEFAIEIRYPAEGKARYAVVIGRAGESFGLSVNDSLEDLKQLIASSSSQGMLSGDYSVLSFTYESPFYLAFEDLDAIEKYGWDIPNEKAYPSILRFNPKKGLLLPGKEDIFWLEAVLSALNEFFGKHFDADEFFLSFGEKEQKYKFEVQTLGGKKSVLIKLPVMVY